MSFNVSMATQRPFSPFCSQYSGACCPRQPLALRQVGFCSSPFKPFAWNCARLLSFTLHSIPEIDPCCQSIAYSQVIFTPSQPSMAGDTDFLKLLRRQAASFEVSLSTRRWSFMLTGRVSLAGGISQHDVGRAICSLRKLGYQLL